MNKTTMENVARLLRALNTLTSQCNRLTIREVLPKTRLQERQVEFADDQGVIAVATAIVPKDEEVAPSLHLQTSAGGRHITAGEWWKFRELGDSLFADYIPHVNGQVLCEVEDACAALRGDLRDVVAKKTKEQFLANEAFNKAEDMFIPDGEKPLGPLFDGLEDGPCEPPEPEVSADEPEDDGFEVLEDIEEFPLHVAPGVNHPDDVHFESYPPPGEKKHRGVRLTHNPTGEVVECHNFAEIGENEAEAVRLMRDKLNPPASVVQELGLALTADQLAAEMAEMDIEPGGSAA